MIESLLADAFTVLIFIFILVKAWEILRVKFPELDESVVVLKEYFFKNGPFPKKKEMEESK